MLRLTDWRRLAPAFAWLAGGIALWTGADWVRAALAVAFAISGRAAFRDFAVGHAEGRKSAELAAAPEDVLGRARPGPVDYAMSGAYVALTRLLPAAALLYAMWAL